MYARIYAWIVWHVCMHVWIVYHVYMHVCMYYARMNCMPCMCMCMCVCRQTWTSVFRSKKTVLNDFVVWCRRPRTEKETIAIARKLQTPRIAMSVQEYLEKHKLSQRIEDAVNAAVRSKAPDPLIFIVCFNLSLPPSPSPCLSHKYAYSFNLEGSDLAFHFIDVNICSYARAFNFPKTLIFTFLFISVSLCLSLHLLFCISSHFDSRTQGFYLWFLH